MREFRPFAIALILPLAFLAADAIPLLKRSAPAAEEARGLVWRIDGGRAPVFLAGSFHLLREKDLPYPSTLDAAYEASRELWFELDPAELEKADTGLRMLTAGTLPEGRSLSDVLSPATLRRLKEWDGPPQARLLINRMQPWMAAITLTMIEYQKLGADPRFGVERAFAGRAREDGKPAGGLESVDFQISLFSRLTPAQQEEMLLQTFDELKGARKLMARLIETWRQGDEKKLSALLQEGFDAHPELKKIMLTDRNERWMEKIEALRQGEQPALVVVGAAHLCGDGSVIDLAERRGWKLVRLEPGQPAVEP